MEAGEGAEGRGQAREEAWGERSGSLVQAVVRSTLGEERREGGVPGITQVGRRTLTAVGGGVGIRMVVVQRVVARVVERSSKMEVSQAGVVRRGEGRGLVQVKEAAVVLGEGGGSRLVEARQAGAAHHGGAGVVTQVGETGVGVLQGGVQHHGVGRGTGAGVHGLSRSVQVGVRVSERDLARVPTRVAPVGLRVLPEVAVVLLNGGEVGDALGPPGRSLTSRRQVRWRAGAVKGMGRPGQVSGQRFRGDGSLCWRVGSRKQ